MKEKLRAEKEWLKATAIEIRKTREEWKHNQRTYDFSIAPLYNDPKWEEKLRERGRMYAPARKLWKLSWDYRHRHIAYSLARGNTYYQIERTVREGNEPDMKRVTKILEEEYRLKWIDINELPVQIEEAA
jgi:hypothetical protein